MNYIGYFKGLNDVQYEVQIVKDSTQAVKEILLAGASPFVVRYNSSTTPFDGIRTSTATISIVHDTYLEDVLPSTARETRVILRSGNQVLWDGYLTPKIYDQSYRDEIETIELEAADCLSSTQYIPYETDVKGVKSFRDIIGDVLNQTNIEGFYWPATRWINNKQVYPDELMISTHNFYSSDSNEPWNGKEIIEEISKYLGFTAIQKGKWLFFVDYAYLSKNPGIPFSLFSKINNYTQSTTSILGNLKTITQNDLTGGNEEVGFEPIYNKFVVKDSFYEAEDFISNIFDDNYLTNRNGDFFTSIKLDAPPSGFEHRPEYPWGAGLFAQKLEKDASDWDYVFFHRLYDHEQFESVYRDDTLYELKNLPDTTKKSQNITRDYVGATILDLGVARKEYTSDSNQTVVTNKVDWNRYLCINQRGKGWGYENVGKGYGEAINDKMVVFRLKPGFRSNIILDASNYLVINYSMLFTKYYNRNYINPDWTTQTFKKSWNTDGTAEGTQFGTLAFKLGFGNKYWNGSNWQNGPTTFEIPCVREEDDYGVIMQTREVLNNVGWELDIHEEGYKIHLLGVDTSDEMTFEIYLPKLQLLTDFPRAQPLEYNQYCWIKDFSMKITKVGQDKEVEEADVVYENIVNEENVNEMDEIELKITTSVSNSKSSYSNVVYFNKSTQQLSNLTTIYEPSISQNMTPEENIIARYHKQYSTPTKKLTYTLNTDLSLLDVYQGMDFENSEARYVQLGTEIDYKNNQQIMELVELK